MSELEINQFRGLILRLYQHEPTLYSLCMQLTRPSDFFVECAQHVVASGSATKIGASARLWSHTV